MTLGDKLLASLFQSASARTAGFNTVDIGFWHNRTLMFFVMLMFIGAGPQGTAGGIKIPTFVTLLAYIRASFRGRPKVVIFNYTVSKISVGNAVKLYVLSSSFIFTTIILLTLIEDRSSIMQLIFETASAFGTVGLSTGITFGLASASKLILIITMFVGRVGLINIGSAIIKPTSEISQSQLTIDDGMKLQIG
jgi:trk system potassium uptake protein TrkH